jgi:hypothetical protein
MNIEISRIYHWRNAQNIIAENHGCETMLENAKAVKANYWGAIQSLVPVTASFPCIQLFSICNAAFG